MYTLRCEMLSGRGLAETFAVFEDPHNLAKITPGWLNFRVTSAEPVQMRKGAEINYVIRWLGLPMRWKTIIAEYDPPRGFVDEQEHGPYARWRHHHTFEETQDGTRVSDRVEYALPFGLFGRIAHSLIVRRQLLAIFRYRQSQLEKMFGGRAKQLLEPTIAG